MFSFVYGKDKDKSLLEFHGNLILVLRLVDTGIQHILYFFIITWLWWATAQRILKFAWWKGLSIQMEVTVAIIVRHLIYCVNLQLI